ncbi:DNA polymerase III subunit beta, partial [Patescibacteria group bacterium]
ISKPQIIKSLKKIITSASNSDIRPEISSTLFNVRNNFLVLTTTDSFRLSEEKIPKKYFSSKTSNFSFLLPKQTTEELIRILDNIEENDIEASLSQKDIIISTKTLTIFSRLTDGKFPEYQDIIPKNFSTNIFVNRKKLMENIRSASIFADKLFEVCLKLNSKENTLTLSTKNREVGEHSSSIDVDSNGKDIELVLNWRYLLDGIVNMEDEEIFLGINDKSNPIIIKPKKMEDSIYLIMPMKEM